MERKKYESPKNGKSISIFVDGPSNDDIEKYNKYETVFGYTFNPTLFRQLNITDYLEHCKNLVKICDNLSVSLEVIADDKIGMMEQAMKLTELDESVEVKIPISFTSGESTKEVIKELS